MRTRTNARLLLTRAPCSSVAAVALVLLIGLSLALTAPRTAAQEIEPPRKLSARQKARLLTSDIVFVGTLLELGQRPKYWTGGAGMSYQALVFSNDEPLRGPGELRQIAVFHSLIKGSKLSAQDRPGVSTEIYARGKKFVVAASFESSWDPACLYDYRLVHKSIRARDEVDLEEIRGLLSKDGSR